LFMEPVNDIRELLYHHDCVIVPGLGGFVINPQSARIDRVAGIFCPPSRIAGFNAGIDHNDGLLVSHLSARLSMNYVDARKLVDAFVLKVKHRLFEGRSVHFEGIGRFVVDRDHNLHFEPDPSANFLTEAYGLSFFRYPDLETRRKGKQAPVVSGERSRPGLSRMLRYAAIGIPLVAVMGWGAMNTGVLGEFSFNITSLNPFSAVTDTGSKFVAPPANGRETASYPVAGPREEIADDGEYSGAAPGPEDHDIPDGTPEAYILPGPAPQTEALPAENTAAAIRSHYLVAGSFLKRSNAAALSMELAGNGYETGIIEAENGMLRVTMYSSTNRREALQMLRKMRADLGRPDIWMLSM
jgi:hypothetical protein